MIEKLTVDEIYARPGFLETAIEYSQITDPILPDPPHPDVRKEDYQALEKAGLLAVYAATIDKCVVGLATCMKGKIPHYGTPITIVESLYLQRRHRASKMGIGLIDACEDCSRIWGIPQIFIQVHDEELIVLGKVLEYRNYSARIHTYGRLL